MKMNANLGINGNGNFGGVQQPTMQVAPDVYGLGTPVVEQTIAPNPFGIDINKVSMKELASSESVLNSIIEMLPDTPNSDVAINHIKALVNNRKLSVEKDMSPVTKVFTEKVDGALKELLVSNPAGFDRTVDSILARDTASVAPVGNVGAKSKYAGVGNNAMYELLRAAISYMNKQKITNINLGKFNKILNDMASETKSKKFKEVISSTPVAELYNTFKGMIGGNK